MLQIIIWKHVILFNDVQKKDKCLKQNLNEGRITEAAGIGLPLQTNYLHVINI